MIASAFLALLLISRPSVGQDSILAHRFYRAALDQAALTQNDSALALYHAALRADPTYLPAHLEVMRTMQARNAGQELVRLYGDPDTAHSPFSRCLALMARALARRASPVPGLLALERSGKATSCSTVFLQGLIGGLGAGSSDSLILRNGERAIGLAPEMEGLWQAYSGALSRAGHWDSADSVLQAAEKLDLSPLTLLFLRVFRADLARARGDTARAEAMERGASEIATRDGRPMLRIIGARFCCHGDPIATEKRELDIARSARGWFQEWEFTKQLGHSLLDAGQPLRSLPYQNRLVAIAEGSRIAGLELVSYSQRGRAYIALGRLKEAERDLLRAVHAATIAGDPYFVADAWHNLAHMYEAAGRWADADRAVNRFSAITRPMGDEPLRMTSLHDAGIIRWKAGWHAAARAAFEEMVGVVDEQGNNHYWAGEYLERSGELARALAYYRIGAAIPGGQQALNLAGLSRVYQQLGMADSAEVAARQHDAIQSSWTPLELPLLPHLLASHGRRNEAVALAREWALRQRVSGNVQGATLAALDVGELLLDGAQPEAARIEAVTAESLARKLNFTDELIHARRLEGLALARSGQHTRALGVLHGAAVLAARHPTADAVFETQFALGEALEGAGREGEALAAYDHAARTVERVTVGLEEDLDRAGYRDRHLLPFDGALRILLRRRPTAGNLDSLLVWSERRTGAALALATGMTTHAIGAATVRVAQRKLQRREALVAYLLLDSSVAAILVTREQASLIRLPITRSRLQTLVSHIRQPLVTTYGGRIDIARARFDRAAAHELYSTLIAPFAPLLAGCDRLAIVPEGPLNQLPFQALIITDPARASTGPGRSDDVQYLIDQFEISYFPSAAFLAGRTGSGLWHTGAGTRILALEHGIPDGAVEVAAIRAAWPINRVTTFEGTAATESAVRTSGDGYAILHFATHAIADDHDPLASQLRLQSDGLDDGYLHVNEISSERFVEQLVVLSGCESGSGPLYQGEGVMSLARAFLAAGAHSVAATQWPIGPRTAELMSAFYRRLAAGDDPAKALRAAQLAVRRNPATAHPFYWASFVLVEGT